MLKGLQAKAITKRRYHRPSSFWGRLGERSSKVACMNKESTPMDQKDQRCYETSYLILIRSKWIEKKV
jgi:hypothetical protein